MLLELGHLDPGNFCENLILELEQTVQIVLFEELLELLSLFRIQLTLETEMLWSVARKNLFNLIRRHIVVVVTESQIAAIFIR